jgi:hypothetical protein
MRSWTLACSILTLLAATACKAPKAPDPGKVAAAGAEASKASQAAEAQRLLVLRMQVGFIDREAPYGDVGAPAGFEWVVARAPDAALVKATRGKWDVARGKVQAAVAPGAPASTSLEAQQAFTWLTSRLEEMYEATGDTEAAQNVDTTALDILKDPGYRQELACHLARAAANHGDVAYAKTWLATTDARPADINLDSEERMAKVAVAFAERDWAGALAQLGRTRADVPFASRWAVNASVKRAHALEQLGDVAAAADELAYWLRGPVDRALVLRVPRAAFAQQIEKMVTAHSYAPQGYAQAKARLKAPRNVAESADNGQAGAGGDRAWRTSG